jgi:hypothetical protein
MAGNIIFKIVKAGLVLSTTDMGKILNVPPDIIQKKDLSAENMIKIDALEAARNKASGIALNDHTQGNILDECMFEYDDTHEKDVLVTCNLSENVNYKGGKLRFKSKKSKKTKKRKTIKKKRKQTKKRKTLKKKRKTRRK